jgi:tRNA/tmRNA/rRNA uracil-C5-methylase (TrmA/RlmC/RlmD family)
VPEAIKDAWINAELNKLKDQSYFVVGKAEKIIFSDKNIRSKLDKIGLIVVDPPRD